MNHPCTIVEKCIRNVSDRFKTFPDIFLTEEDVRGHLFSELLKNYGDAPERTLNGSMTTPTHSNFSWYNRTGSLRPRPDISIVDPQHVDTSIENSKDLLAHDIPFAIEIKLNRKTDKKKAKIGLYLDLKKMADLKTRNAATKFYAFYLDKKAILTEPYLLKMQTKYPESKIVYVSSVLSFGV